MALLRCAARQPSGCVCPILPRGGRQFSELSESQARSPPSAGSFLEFGWRAHQDVAAISGDSSASSPLQRLQRLSEVALDVWPREAPQWRVAAPLVAPSLSRTFAQQDRSSFSAAIAAAGLTPESRAACLRTLCECHGSPRLARGVLPMLTALVEGAEESHNLANRLPPQELSRCILAIGRAPLLQFPVQDAPLRNFLANGVRRLAGGAAAKMTTTELHELRCALHRCGLETPHLDTELRKRLQHIGDAASQAGQESTGSLEADLAGIVACSHSLSMADVLRSARVRNALLPDDLSAEMAAKLLPHALPMEAAPDTAHEFVVGMATRQLESHSRFLDIGDLSCALQGAVAWQVSGDRSAIHHAARILRTVWPWVASKLSYLGPDDLALALKGYCWQLQYSQQEFAVQGALRDHPFVESVADARDGGHSMRSAARTRSELDFKTKLVQPVLSRLSEMPLRQMAVCLTSLAPGVSEQGLLDDDDRAAVKAALDATFPAEEQNGRRWADFREEYLAGQMHALTTSELLELTCSLGEFRGGARWVTDDLRSVVEERLRPPRGSRPSVELTHILLLRLCRTINLWQGHAVEEMLTHLLSSPAAVRPLPTSYFVAVLSALCSFNVPKEVPLTLASAFVDRVDCGESIATPEQWVRILHSIRALDDPPWWDRVTPRILQNLVPHVRNLSPHNLALLLQTYASKPQHSKPGQRAESGDAILDHLPAVVTGAVNQAVRAGGWNIEQVVHNLDQLGRLDWYSDTTAAAMVAQCTQTPLLEPHAPLLVPLSRACAALRIHHAPLLNKMVLWYCWSCTYLRPNPLPQPQVDELLEFAGHLLDLSFHSLELQGVLSEQLLNPNASARQKLALLAAMARFAHFPVEFKEACAKVCAESHSSDLAALTSADLVNAFNIHLCAVFDGPAALKHWLTEDEAMKTFFQVHTSQQWYHKQDQERTTFLQSHAYLTLKQAIEDEGLDLRPSDPGDVYHIEFVSKDAKERLGAMPADPPIALVCIKSKEQLRWYIPITADVGLDAEALALQNRCHQFRYMFRGSVQKTRHLQAMGYRTAAIWLSEWTALETAEQRQAYLRTALGTPGRQNATFSPNAAEEEETYC